MLHIASHVQAFARLDDPTMPLRTRVQLGIVALLVPLSMVACTDAPLAGPGAGGGVAHLLFEAQLALPDGSVVVVGTPQSDALSLAFDRVNAFRFVVTNPSDGTPLADVTIQVTPGQDEYVLTVTVPGVVPGATVNVVVTALDGETVLFESAPLAIVTTAAGAASPPAPATVPLQYQGPGVDAVAIEITAQRPVLAPGEGEDFKASVLGTGGVISDVPIAWISSAPTVASVTQEGRVTAVADGRSQITVGTPTGLEASAWVYVVGGDIAYVKDGQVLQSGAAGGSTTTLGGSGSARGPAWAPEGSALFFSESGLIHQAGASSLFDGAWPAVHPDGTRLVAEKDGILRFANTDGMNVTEGPSGSTPTWDPDGRHLFVAGGSIERVQFDGTDRSTVEGGSAAFPTVSPSGSVAYLDGINRVAVVGVGPVSDLPANSRPSLSPAGDWLLYATEESGDLHVVPSAGDGPALPIGVTGAMDPAWKPTAPPASPPVITLSGLDPPEVGPGQQVDILGTGFDEIVPSNNRVFFPGSSGELEVNVLELNPDRIRVQVPSGVVDGDIRVSNYHTEGLLAFMPALPVAGDLTGLVLSVLDGSGISGASVTLEQDGSPLATVSTAGDGSFTFTGLMPGLYDLQVTKTMYVPTTFFGVEVFAGQSTTLETIVLVPQGSSPGFLFGGVIDGGTGGPVFGATVELRQGMGAVPGPPLANTSSNSSGQYFFESLQPGTYTVSGSASGFIDGSRTAQVVSGAETGADVVLAPSDGSGSGIVRVILTWGSEPEDLDSHLTGPAGGTSRFHVYFDTPGSLTSPPFAELDVDDQFRFGPETISFIQNESGVFRYSVHDFTNKFNTSGSQLAASGAKVEVFKGPAFLRSFFVPNAPGTLWTVFELEGEVLTPINAMSFEQNSSAVPAPGRFDRAATDVDLIKAATKGGKVNR